MREIKFRAWDGKKLLSPQDLTQSSKYWEWLGKQDVLLEQSTGKKAWLKINDLKGKVDLFDGDIVSFRIPDCIGNLTSHVGQIYWCDCAFWVDCTDIEGDEGIYGLGEVLIQDENVEVIGNIHENPELLEDSCK